MSGASDFEEEERTRLQRRLDRERQARLESEAIGERALRELSKKQQEVELLQAIAVAANESSSVEEALQICLDRVCAHTGWPVGHVYVLTEEATTGELTPTAIWHLEHPERFATTARCRAEAVYDYPRDRLSVSSMASEGHHVATSDGHQP